ncbi:MAG: EAL domain-containing protein [Ruminococcaceae bacterium]|nr:EAL domain-containing protein [Oscillospiraceae bacterium]
MNYIYEFDIAACALMIMFSVLLAIRKNFPTYSNKLYACMLAGNLFATAMDLVTVFTIAKADTLPLWVNYLTNIVYLTSFNGCAVLYYMYVLAITKENRTTRLDRAVAIAVITIDVVFISTTPLTKWIFFFDEENNYCHGPLMLLLYVTAVFMLFYSFLISVKYRHSLTKYQIVSIVIFNLSLIGAIILQAIFSDILLQGFACSLYLIVVYVSLQNPDDYMDKTTGCFNQYAFNKTLEKHIVKNTPFTVLSFVPDDFQYINCILGVKNTNELIDSISVYLMNEFNAQNVFHLYGCRYAVMIDENTGDLDSTVFRLKAHFAKPCVINGTEVQLSPKMCFINYPDFANTPEDITDSLEFCLKTTAHDESNELVAATEEALVKKNRENQIVHIMKRAIQNNEFKVYYQPLYSTEKGRFTSAEALVRLIDPELGFIPPDEFIPLAERNGLIAKIGELIFRSVCEFMHRSDIFKLGVEYIEVNLSTVQCMQENLAPTMLSIMKEFSIAPNRINFEITETAHSINDKTLINTMNALIKEGSTFSMDDYGTGFSTANYLIRLPLYIVKIDKSILWPAMKSEEAMNVLKHTVMMLKSLNKGIVVEGVEDEAMASLLIDMGVEFLQGYYYSKPIPEQSYIEFLQEHQG